jgi:hypothetical protein
MKDGLIFSQGIQWLDHRGDHYLALNWMSGTELFMPQGLK